MYLLLRNSQGKFAFLHLKRNFDITDNKISIIKHFAIGGDIK